MEQIRGLSEHLTKTQRELDRSRHDTDALREENRQLRHDLSQVTQSNPGHHGVMPYSAQPPTPMESYSSDQYGRAHQVHYEHRQDTRQALPPLNSLHPVQAGPETMSGVQYQHELDRGFRQGYPPRN